MDPSSIGTIGLGVMLTESAGNRFMWVGEVTGKSSI